MTVAQTADTDEKLDPRIARSEAAIAAALLEQLRLGRGLSTLTVSEVAEQAGVTRKTFYARFGSLEQVAERIVADLFGRIEADIEDEMLRLPVMDNRLSLLAFEGYQAYESTLDPLLKQCPTGVFTTPVSEVIRRLLRRAVAINQSTSLDEMAEAYLISLLASSLHGVLVVWVERGRSDAPADIAEFVDSLILPGVQKLLMQGSGT